MIYSLLEGLLILEALVSEGREKNQMAQTEFDGFCELEVKGPCITCDFIQLCNGKWRNGTRHGASVQA